MVDKVKKIWLEGELIDWDDAKVHVAFRDEGKAVVLSVLDNGPGLPEAVLAKLFTPFVTTTLKGLAGKDQALNLDKARNLNRAFLD